MTVTLYELGGLCNNSARMLRFMGAGVPATLSSLKLDIPFSDSCCRRWRPRTLSQAEKTYDIIADGVARYIETGLGCQDRACKEAIARNYLMALGYQPDHTPKLRARRVR